MSFALLLAASLPVFAQTNVTVYGVADATLENVRTSGSFRGANLPGKQRVTSNSSLLGFRGTESLGNGLEAVFQYETTAPVDGSGATLFTTSRDSFVGIKGGFGLVKLGIHSSPVRRIGTRMDYTPGSTGIANNESILSRIGGRTGNPGFGDRMANAVMYDSPAFGGFSVGLIYGANESKREGSPSQDDSKFGFGLQYAGGPFYLSYGFERRNDMNIAFAPRGVATPANFTIAVSATGQNNEASSHRVGADYNGGAFKVGLVWDRTEVDSKLTTLGEARRDAYGAVASAKLGPGELHAQFLVARDVKGSFCSLFTCGETGARNFTVGYDYPFSKRTMIKLHFAQTDNDDDASYDLGNANLLSANASNASGFKARAVAAGIRHTF
jgi:predicted porin